MNSCRRALLWTLLPSLLSLALTGGAEAGTGLEWTSQSAGVTARLRGVSAISAQQVWASGSGHTVLRSADGGASWTAIAPPAESGAAALDFRDIDAIDANTAYVLSIGEGAASRIYKTRDAGAHWTLQYTNPDAKGFLDAMSFWDAEHGLVMGDSIEGRFQILRTVDGGAHWAKVPDSALPPALPGEGAFAASGSNIAVLGQAQAWIVTNSPGRSRVLHTADGGQSWSVVDSPLPATASAGIFSVAFRDALHGVIVGGDYKNETAAVDNVATTRDGGKTWQLAKQGQGLSGFRSAVKYIPGSAHSLIAVGPQGADRSDDDGASWTPLTLPAASPGFDALSIAPDGATAWASGQGGALARLKLR
jgi:photosystem II stability/assembly factor-like uncharacterized protein